MHSSYSLRGHCTSKIIFHKAHIVYDRMKLRVTTKQKIKFFRQQSLPSRFEITKISYIILFLKVNRIKFWQSFFYWVRSSVKRERVLHYLHKVHSHIPILNILILNWEIYFTIYFSIVDLSNTLQFSTDLTMYSRLLWLWTRLS